MSNETLSLKTLDKKIQDVQESTRNQVNEVKQEITGLHSKLASQQQAFFERMETRMKAHKVDRTELKDAAADALADEIDDAARAVKYSRPVRIVRAIGRELKPGLPNHDHVKGGALTTGGALVAARFVPPVRDAVIQLITP